MVVDITVWLMLTVYVPTPPIPVTLPETMVPGVIVPPVITWPAINTPAVTPVTVNVVPAIDPVTTALEVSTVYVPMPPVLPVN